MTAVRQSIACIQCNQCTHLFRYHASIVAKPRIAEDSLHEVLAPFVHSTFATERIGLFSYWLQLLQSIGVILSERLSGIEIINPWQTLPSGL